MKIKLVFNDWTDREFNSVYHDTELSNGDFHSGTTFKAEVDVLGNDEELLYAMRRGFRPVFYAIEDKDDAQTA